MYTPTCTAWHPMGRRCELEAGHTDDHVSVPPGKSCVVWDFDASGYDPAAPQEKTVKAKASLPGVEGLVEFSIPARYVSDRPGQFSVEDV